VGNEKLARNGAFDNKEQEEIFPVREKEETVPRH
jgi:hypothetical protein